MRGNALLKKKRRMAMNDIRTMILDALALVAFIGAMVLLLAAGSMR